MPILRVLPNPWSARDKEGRPCGVCPRDPDADGGGPGQYVGARVDRKRTEILQKLERGDDLRSPMQRTAYEYLGIASDDRELAAKLLAAAPIELPATKYYRDRISDRSLLAADAETARIAKLRRFEPPARALSRYLPAAPAKAQEKPAAEPIFHPTDDPKPYRRRRQTAATDEVAES